MNKFELEPEEIQEVHLTQDEIKKLETEIKTLSKQQAVKNVFAAKKIPMIKSQEFIQKDINLIDLEIIEED